MKQFIRFLILLFSIIPSLLLCATTLNAEENQDRWGVGFFPIIGYEDETSLVLGVNSVFYFNPNPEDKTQELDELELNANASLKGHYNLSSTINKYFNGNHRNLETRIGFSKSPSDFYGIGGNTPESNQEAYTSMSFPFKVTYSVDLWDGFYVGALYDFNYFDISSMEDDGMLSSGEITGSETSHSSGFGLKLTYNRVNTGLYKRDGFKVSFSNLHYSPILGSSTAFHVSSLDYRHYIPLFSDVVLGLQVRAIRSTGDVPFYYLPSVGGSKILRGYGSSRYIAANHLSAQTELRFPIWWRLGGAAFFGVGEVADEFEDFGTNVRSAGGIGLRVTVQKKQNINIRFDIAMNSDGESKKYIKIQEAF